MEDLEQGIDDIEEREYDIEVPEVTEDPRVTESVDKLIQNELEILDILERINDIQRDNEISIVKHHQKIANYEGDLFLLTNKLADIKVETLDLIEKFKNSSFDFENR